MAQEGISGFSEHLYSALSLAERASYLRQDLNGQPGSDGDATRAAAAINRWKSQKPFSTGDFFAQRLRQDGLTEHDLQAILELSPDVYSQRLTEPPDWVRELEELYVTRRPPDGNPADLRHV